jgi:fibronectin-binding autotransporter adhesin
MRRIKFFELLRFVLAGVLLGICAAPAPAANYFWNGIGASGSAGGGSGTWDLTTTNWQSAATSGSAVAWPNVNNAHAATFGGASGTVTWGSGMSTANPNGINVTSGTFTLNLNNQLMTIFAGGFTVTGGQMTLQSGTLTAGAVNGIVGTSLTGANALTISAKITGSGVSISKFGAGDLILTNDSNDFTGKVYGQNGFGVYFSSIADAGVASAVGAGSLVQTGLNNTMVYTGTGASTNRTFEVVGGGSDTLRNNGTGALIWTGSFSNTKSGASTLTLSGTNTGGSNEFRGNLVDGSFAMGLAKADSNTWILTGANTYTGATTVSAGTLQIGNGGTTGSLSGSSSISVSSGATLAFSRSNTITQGTDFNSVISGAGNLTKLSSGTLVLSGSNTYTGTTSINAGTLQIGASGTTGSLSASSAITGSAGATLAFNRTDTYGGNVSNTIGGGIAVTQLGTGTVTLAGSNTFTGTTRIVAGGLTLGNVSALQNSTLDMNTGDAGTLAFGLTGTNTYVIGSLIGSRNIATSGSVVLSVGGNGSSGSYTGVLGGGGAFTKAGSGTLTLAGANTYTGTTSIGGGVLQANVADVASTSGALGNGGSIRFTGGTLQYTASSAGTDWSSRITSSTGAIAIDTNGQNVNLTGTALASTNTGGLTKLGSGTLSVTMGASTVSGTTTVNGGVLRIANPGDLLGYNANRFLINNASTLIVTNTTGGNRSWILNSATVVFDAAGGGTLVIGSGNHLSQFNQTTTVRTTGGVQNLMSGGTTGGFINGQNVGLVVFDVARGTDPSVDLLMSASLSSINIQKTGGGILSVRQGTSGNFGITVSQGTFDVGGSATLAGGTFSGTIANSGLFQYSSSANQTLSGTISGTGALTQAGASTLTLSGSNSYTGATTVSSGTLVAGGASAFGAQSGNITASGGVLNLGGYNFTRTGTVSFTGGTTQSGTITNDTVAFVAQAGTVSAGLAGAAGLTKSTSGTVTLSGANNFSGTTNINAGTLQIGNNGTTGGLSSSSAITGSSGATLAFSRTDNYGGSFTNTIGGGIGVTLNSGTLTLSGSNAYGGATTVSGGQLRIANSSALGSTALGTTISGSGVLGLDGSGGPLSIAENITIATTQTGALANLSGTNTLTGLVTITSSPVDYRVAAGRTIFAGGITSSNNSGLSLNGAATIQTSAVNIGTGEMAFTSSGNSVANSIDVNVAGNTWGTTRINFGGYTRLGVDGALPSTAGVEFGWSSDGQSAGTLDLNGKTQTVAFLRQTSAFPSVNGDQNITGGGSLTVNAASGTFEYHGRITDGATATALVKNGVGTQILMNNTGTASNFTGGLTVNAGTLRAGALNSLGGATNPVAVNAGTLNLGGFSASLGMLSGSAGGVITTGTAAGTATLTTSFTGTSTFAGVISDNGSGIVALTKAGAGTLRLTGSSGYTGATTVTAGVLAVDGQISSAVTVATGATVGGSGVISGALSGAGTVSPGNSPGILTAGQFDATGGLDAAFEFMALAPVYNDSSASLNDVLRLTSGTPIVGTLTGGNLIDVYFNVNSIATGDTFEGGFFTELSASGLLSAVENAMFTYWIKDNAGSTSFNGVSYSPLSSLPSITGVTLQTANVTRTFAGGSVSGSVTQFVIVPEPGALTLVVGGVVAAAWVIRRRR